MSTTLVHLEDHTMLWTATTTARSSGDVVVRVNTVGICKVDIAAAGTGAVYIRGVHNVTKTTASAFAVGDSVYWEATSLGFSLVATGNQYAGRVYSVSTAGQTTAQILLNFGTKPVGTAL
jgi:predicted RecA/RadA family phage recombinase